MIQHCFRHRSRLTSRVVIGLLAGVLVLAAGCSKSTDPEPPPSGPRLFTYTIQDVYPHDPNAFTQGLVYIDSTLYEGTGIRGASTLRRVDLLTGTVVQIRAIADRPGTGDYFGEGIVVVGDTIIQLTWTSGVAIVYDRESFDSLGTFAYSTQGWGLTFDGSRLLMSDGSDTLYFRDPGDFSVIGQVAVHDGDREVRLLNELEYIAGKVYANVWFSDSMAVIDPADGRVTAWIDLTGLLETEGVFPSADVLNGIAYDAINDRLLVTGKLWPRLFHIDLVGVP